MKDLAGSGSTAAAAPRQLAAAADEGRDAEEGGVNPAAQQRLGSLADKVRQAAVAVAPAFVMFASVASTPSMSPAAVLRVSTFCRTLHPLIRCES